MRRIAEYAVTASEAKDNVRAFETFIVYDFFNGYAEVSIEWINESTTRVNIKQEKQPKKKRR